MKSVNVQNNLKYYGQSGGKRGKKPSPNKVRSTGKKIKQGKGFSKKKPTPMFTSGNSVQ